MENQPLNYARGSSTPSLINPTFTVEVERKAERMKKKEGEIAPAFKMLIIQMRQSVPAWCQCHHSSNYYHDKAITMANRSVIYLVKAIRCCD